MLPEYCDRDLLHVKIHAVTARYLPTLASRAKHDSSNTSAIHVQNPKYDHVILKTKTGLKKWRKC